MTTNTNQNPQKDEEKEPRPITAEEARILEDIMREDDRGNT